MYEDLNLSPRKKKRCLSPLNSDDETTMTPKRLRTAPITPPATISRRTAKADKAQARLPTHLSRLGSIQNAIQHALSHALATCAVSPTESGYIRNVLNHFSLTTYSGLTTQFNIDDLKRLCWVWEWDGESLPNPVSPPNPDDDNPFLEETPTPVDWTRGSMGVVLSSATHYSKSDRKRIPAYGIGIEVEMDLDKDMAGGMAAVARWTAAAETRRKEFLRKLQKWMQLHSQQESIPLIPLADLPPLKVPTKISSLTRTLASASPKGAISSFSLPGPPASPSRSPSKSPAKRALPEFSIPFPRLSAGGVRSPVKNSVPFPQTPSKGKRPEKPEEPPTPRTPSNTDAASSDPSTPQTQRTIPQTPSSSRRQALYERIRQRSLTASPTKSPTKAKSHEVVGGKLTRDQMLKMGQEEMRRRCLLGRLGGVAESAWMLFSTPTSGSSSTPTVRKRRTLPTSEVATAIIKSSPVPISMAEANESLAMLTKLCPFFLKPLSIGGTEWLEMPASGGLGVSTTDSASTPSAPPSPGPNRGKNDSANELVTRSPRRVKREAGGLREVREIIRKELELQD